ncbi:hypothetical protein N7516_007311 [Penicillium verrucosum]|uniref:uncharacterized protein n=1 Tax=Penicillium psychrosexuale TaxID=1002107 RepID=UPI0025454E0E|nr:uncharacterized protein N7518_009102 [Penicillium psychrosexuale]XP_057074122.1 uncharacterized protein N7516_007311 [Penicillium verrucosum]KAJ5783425.1 hypothetical protein N7518_009102 [Penicillium psychrosexuale]KAJ5932822.1 hypothetical protein N7516_007311 [Penicillium verrucosum]
MSEHGRSPSMDNPAEGHDPTFNYQKRLYSLMDKLLRQEQESRRYHGHLESKINVDSSTYLKLRDYCVQVERKVSALEYIRSQQETSLRFAVESCQVMSNNLNLQRNKVNQLESRLIHLYPAIDEMLCSLNDNDGTQKSQNMEQLLQENQRQRELNTYLQGALSAREEMLQDLKTSLAEAFLGFPAGDHDTENHEQRQDESVPSSLSTDDRSTVNNFPDLLMCDT